MYFVLCTRLTIQILDQYIRKHLSSIKMVVVIKLHFNTRPFGFQPLFNHLNTKLVWYSYPPLSTSTKIVDNIGQKEMDFSYNLLITCQSGWLEWNWNQSFPP